MIKRTLTCLLLAAASALAADSPMQLPAGHPEMPHLSPTTMPAAAVGSLKIRVVQRTAQAPAPAGDKVTVHFYQGEKVVKHSDVTVDAEGVATVSDIALTRQAVQAMVMVHHGEITYQAMSRPMNSGMPTAEVEVSVYESTKDVPAWRIPMRHLIASQTPEGVRIVEMLAVDNPSDRTWTGTSEPEEGATLVLRLPAGATNLELGDGFSKENVHFHNGTMMNLAPMTPGVATYQFAYTVPVEGGKVHIPVIAPVTTQQLMMFVPDDGTEIKTNGLQAAKETRKTQDGMMRMLSTAGLPAGQTASLTILGVADTVVAATPGKSWTVPQIMGAAGVGIVLVGGIAFMLLKPVKPQPGKK